MADQTDFNDLGAVSMEDAVDVAQADLESLRKEAGGLTTDKVKEFLQRLVEARLGRTEQESVLRAVKEVSGATLGALRVDLLDT
ncbi:MAG: hypothetical protein ACREX4_20835, partial [Gammaproteobacteria bacterium]